jgi:hypothetical protein
MQGLRVVVFVDRQAMQREHRTSVQSRIHLHDRNAGFAISGQQRTLDWRRAAPPRQQRSMNIDCAVRRNLECARRQDQSVRRNHQDARQRGSKAIERALVLQTLRLKNVQAARGSQLLDRACRWTQAPARRAIRLRQYQRDVMPGIEQRRQRARRKLWSTGEY